MREIIVASDCGTTKIPGVIDTERMVKLDSH
jgi:hypothetical protein